MSTTYAWNHEVASTTLSAFVKKIHDNISEHIPLYGILFGGKSPETGKPLAKRKPKKQHGGKEIIIPLRYARSGTVASVGEWEPDEPTHIKGVAHGTARWKYYRGTTAISWQMRQQNAGKHQVVSLLEDLKDDLVNGFKESINTALIGNGTGNGGKDMLGLAAYIERDPTSSSLLGISKAWQTWWRNKTGTDLPAGAFSTAFLTGGQGIKDMRRMYHKCGYSAKGAGSSLEFPDYILCSLGNYEGYEALAYELRRISEIKRTDLGFQGLRFKDATMLYTPGLDDGPENSTSKQMWLNTLHLYPVCDPSWFFKMDPFNAVSMYQRQDMVATTYLATQMCGDNVSRQGYLEWTSDTN